MDNSIEGHRVAISLFYIVTHATIKFSAGKFKWIPKDFNKFSQDDFDIVSNCF